MAKNLVCLQIWFLYLKLLTLLSFSCENLASVHNLKDDAKDFNVEHLSHKTGLRENNNLTVSWLRKLGDLYHNLPTNVQYHILNKLPVQEKWPNTTICAKECLYEQEGKAPPRTSFECLFNLCITLIYIISFSKFLCVCVKNDIETNRYLIKTILHVNNYYLISRSQTHNICFFFWLLCFL